MSQWYLSKNGQALGPMDTSKVEALIQSKELQPMDLIYRQGETEWKPVNQFEEFANSFNKAPTPPQNPEPIENTSTEVKEWVLLKKIMKDDGGKEYKQLGPYSRHHVMKLLDEGEISFTDFAWKQGMESWEKIARLEAFDEPLPSSPGVDTALYEKTEVGDLPTDTIEKTMIDTQARASLTELVNIERFDHQKTQVLQRNERLDEAMDPQSKLNIPINTQDFVTDSGVEGEQSESDISLWSLEPPPQEKQKAQIVEDDEVTEAAPKKKAKSKAKKQKPKKLPDPPKKQKPRRAPPRDQDRVTFGERLSSMDPEAGLWAVAILVMLISAFALYRSLQPTGQEVAMDEEPVLEQVETEPVQDQQSQQAQKIAEIQAEYKRKLEQERKALKKREDALLRQQKSAARQAALAQQKLEFEEKQRQMELARQKAEEAEKQKLAEMQKQREIASQKAQELAEKKKKLAKQAAKMSASKKTAPKKKKRKVVKTSTAPRVSRPSGGAKAQSFYKQRDRKALFYSSLRAEQLAVEIEEEFEKLKGNRGAWSKFYVNWIRKVKGSLARDIRRYPKSREKYAYPKIIAEFKKDYQQFYKYGEAFNSKVIGARVPSGTPTGLKGVFAKYKKQALSLGR